MAESWKRRKVLVGECICLWPPNQSICHILSQMLNQSFSSFYLWDANESGERSSGWCDSTAFAVATEIISPLPTAPRACRSADRRYTHNDGFKKILGQEPWLIHISARMNKDTGSERCISHWNTVCFWKLSPPQLPLFLTSFWNLETNSLNWCLLRMWDKAWWGGCGGLGADSWLWSRTRLSQYNSCTGCPQLVPVLIGLCLGCSSEPPLN